MIILISQKRAEGSRKKDRLIYNTMFWYLDAVEEAFCFGQIDSTTKILRTSFPRNALQSADGIASGQNLIKSVADDLKIVIMTDNGRAVEDSGIVVSLICRKMVCYQSKYISNATIGRNYMGKTF